MRHREHLTRTHRTLGIMTWVSMGVTTALGTLVALNRPTWFGAGGCNSANGYNVLGDFGCGSLGAVHEVSALITVGLYATTGIFGLTMPDPEHAATGNDRRGTMIRLHKAAAWVHVVGMVLLPILGVVAVVPSALGIPPETQSDVSIALRSIHIGVGYVTFAALTTAMMLEL